MLSDPSDNGDFLVKRWYFHKREEVDAAMQARNAKEEEEKRQREEEMR